MAMSLAVAPRPSVDTIGVVRRIADEIAAPNASAVDRNARFPNEALLALREAKMLSVLVPQKLGGLERPLSDVATMTELLARRCASAGMVFAMHQIQVAALAWHAGESAWFSRYLTRVAEEQRLIASVTSEVGVGGDLRTSIAAVEGNGGALRLEKRAPTVSYGQHADDLLITARRGPDSAPNDQVLVLAHRSETALEPAGDWNTLGMRGTCSPGFLVRAEFVPDQIVPQPFGEIASPTMVPVSHLLWSAVWSGIASDALSRAHRFVRAEARKTPGSLPPGALRLAEAAALLDTMRARLSAALDEYESLRRADDGSERLASMGYASKLNGLKLTASELVVEIVRRALGILGMAGYREDGELSVGRHLRDAHSAALMINNDRIYGANASMLLVQKEIG
jgi:acyl-CoA dehydrogenase